MKFPHRKRQREKNLKNRTRKNRTDPTADTATKKMLVYPLMGLVFLGSMYLIFASSDKDETKVENVGGFNADIPQPKGDGIISDKKLLTNRNKWRTNRRTKCAPYRILPFRLERKTGTGKN